MLIGLFLVGTASANDSAGSGGAFHPFAFGYRDAQSGNSGASAWDIRIPAGFTLIKPDEDRWGLRLRLTIYAGGYDVNINEPSDYDLTFHSLAATPGVEFLVPVGKGWTLKPFTEVGYAHDFDNSLGVGVWSAGLRTIVFWPLGRKLNLGFGTKVQYLSTFTSDLDLADEFVELRLGFDLRRELGFTIAGNQSYVSLYFIRRQWHGATIEQPGFEPIELRLNNEIGLSFGTDPKVKLWFIRLPRIGLGYRWGPNVRGIRLSFGFPF